MRFRIDVREHIAMIINPRSCLHLVHSLGVFMEVGQGVDGADDDAENVSEPVIVNCVTSNTQLGLVLVKISSLQSLSRLINRSKTVKRIT